MNEYNDQVELLKKIWFTKYARHWTGLCKCSCAFENIFMAELKSSDVLGKLCSHHLLQDKSLQVPVFFRSFKHYKTVSFSGLHSWLFFAKREQDRKANYLGYIDKLDLSGVSHYIT